ncbi:MAG TPA: hypothetical protein VF662_00355 [Allosphingosinicella sp.]|jgi:hypothetical protein
MAKKAYKGGGSGLDLAMAAFAGTAAGFVIYAMPNSQFDRVVELSGLPLILSAAQPPLGLTARLAAVAAVTIATWTLVWLVLRALGKKPPEPVRRKRPVEIEVPLPRIRRADAHPDAPARRPILAGIELGIPLDEAVEQPSPDQADPEADPEDVVEEPEAFDDVEAVETAEEAPSPHGMTEPEEASISHLMQRLELGLLRRERQDWMDGAEATQQNNEPAPQLDQRLRSAIDDLQRLAARSG